MYLVLNDLTAPLVTAVPALVVVVTAELALNAGSVIAAELAGLLHCSVKVQVSLLGLSISAGRAAGAGVEIPGVQTCSIVTVRNCLGSTLQVL